MFSYHVLTLVLLVATNEHLILQVKVRFGKMKCFFEGTETSVVALSTFAFVVISFFSTGEETKGVRVLSSWGVNYIAALFGSCCQDFINSSNYLSTSSVVKVFSITTRNLRPTVVFWKKERNKIYSGFCPTSQFFLENSDANFCCFFLVNDPLNSFLFSVFSIFYFECK